MPLLSCTIVYYLHFYVFISNSYYSDVFFSILSPTKLFFNVSPHFSISRLYLSVLLFEFFNGRQILQKQYLLLSLLTCSMSIYLQFFTRSLCLLSPACLLSIGHLLLDTIVFTRNFSIFYTILCFLFFFILKNFSFRVNYSINSIFVV